MSPPHSGAGGVFSSAVRSKAKGTDSRLPFVPS